MTLVRPGHYRFRAFIRTVGTTTDHGIRFRVSDAEAPVRLGANLGQLTGTNPWSDIEPYIIVPSGTKFFQLQVVGQR
jgi:hypothetical protein